MKRREFITFLGGAAATWPLTARAQQPTKPYRIAFIHPSAPIADMSMSERADNKYFRAFFNELRRFGYIEGTNLVVTRYSAEGREDRFAELCKEVVQTKPDLIVAIASRVVLNLKAATDTIPIVAGMSDPVPLGIVSSISRPEGNITGISVEAGSEIWGKRLELLHEAVPTATNVGVLASRSIWKLPPLNALREAAQQLRISLHGPPLESPMQEEEYRRVFAEMASQHVDGLFIADQGENFRYRRLIFEWAYKAQLPSVAPEHEYCNSGALMAYGQRLTDLYRRLAGYVDQILKGASPGDLPIYLASQFQLVINLSSARGLGLTIPPSLLVRADEVIE